MSNEVQQLSLTEIDEAIEKMARTELGCSGQEAIERLNRGEFSGTILEAELSMLRHLRGDCC